MADPSGIRRGLLALGALALCLAPALLQGCTGAGVPDRLSLFVSGDSRGYLEPCGCRRDQAGGLPGRATVIRGSRAKQKLVVDVGNLTPGSRPYELLKLRYLLQGMKAIGYDAVNLGKNEAELDLETLKKALEEVRLPYVSANVVEKAGGRPVAEPFRIVERGRLRIGITGVTGADPYEVGPGVSVRPPLEALADVVPELKRRCDLLVVLAFVNEDGIREIARKFHEVDCILGGDVPQTSSSPQEINRAISYNVVDKGKVVGELELKRAGGRYRVDTAEGIKIVADRLPADPEMVKLIGAYKSELRERRYELASAEGLERIAGPESGTSTADEFVGEAKCRSCHARPYEVCAASRHHEAFATLVTKKSDFDPECLSCHTVGYGLYSGFVDAARTPHLENVQCESCHGRGKEHVARMSGARTASGGAGLTLAGARGPSTLRPVTPATCIRCHDQENSENFRYAVFWPKIRH